MGGFVPFHLCLFFFAQFITFGVRHRALHGGNHQLALVAWTGLYWREVHPV